MYDIFCDIETILVQSADKTQNLFNISNNELESRLEGRKIGAEARFSCPRGFQLAAGPTVVKCQINGKINIM